MTASEQLRQWYASLTYEYSERKRALQKICLHANVLHKENTDGFPERRCADCGFTEIGGWWCYSVENFVLPYVFDGSDTTNWHTKDYKSGVLCGQVSGRTITKVDDKTFSAAYVP